MIALLVPYLLLCWVVGFGLTFISRMDWPLEGRLAMSIPVGFCTSALLTWLVSIPIGVSDLSVMLGAAAMAVAVAACVRFAPWREQLRAEVSSFGQRWRTRQPLPLLLISVPMSIFFIGFFTHSLQMLPSGLYAGQVFIAGDWPMHLNFVQYLAHAQQLLPPNNPGYTGISLNYPFLPELFSSQLLHLGVDLQTSLPLASCIMCIALVVVFFVTFQRFLDSRWAAFVGCLLLLLGGGLGFFFMGDDIVPVGDGPLGWLGGFGNLLLAPPRDYTWLPLSNIWWGNPVINYIAPQRTVVFGWSLGLLAVSLLWFGWKSHSRREFLLAGIVLGLSPPFQANTFLDIFIIAGGAAVITFRWWRDWIWFFLPAVLLGTPLFYMLLPDASLRFPFFHVTLGWMSIGPRDANWFVWWWNNTGLLVPLALAGSILIWRTRRDLARFLLPAWALFIIPNLFTLQVYAFDNTKWFVWWLIPACMMIGLLITKVASRGRVLALIATAVVVLQAFAGFVSLDRAYQQQLNNPEAQILDADQVAVGDWARQQTDPSAIFLTDWTLNNPIRVLGGRAMLVAGLETLWTTNINYTARLQDVVAMYRGDPGTEQLLLNYGVNYVIIGPPELKHANANQAYYRRSYPMVYRSAGGEYEIYKVR